MDKPILWVPEAYLNTPSSFLKVPGPALPEDDEGEDGDGPLWVIDPENSGDYHLELHDGEGWWTAGVRRDGCIDLVKHFNLPWGGDTAEEQTKNSDYIHICDVDDMIERLQALKEIALQHFEGDWPG